MRIRELDEEIRVVVGDVPVSIDVIQFEMDREVVFRVRHHVRTVLQEICKLKFQLAVAYDAVENALLGDEIALVPHHERPRLAQLDGVTYFCIAPIPNCQGVDGLFEGLYQRLGGCQFR